MTLKNTQHLIIFGGAGFVGKQLTKSMANRYWKVSVVTRRPHRHRDLLVLPSVKLIQKDELNYESISEILNEGDTVVNSIGILNESKLGSFEKVHVEIPKLIAKSCIDKNVRRFIHLSSLGASTDAPSQYLQTKARGEKEVLAVIDHGLDGIIIRPSVIFGKYDSFTNQFASLLKLAIGYFLVISPESKLQPVYINDVIDCLQNAIDVRTTSCRSCDIAGPKVYTMIELVQLIDRYIGRRHKLIPLHSMLAKMLANVLQFVPTKPLTPDNLLSLQVPNVITGNFPSPYGKQSTKFEDVAKHWLSRDAVVFDVYRSRAGR